MKMSLSTLSGLETPYQPRIPIHYAVNHDPPQNQFVMPVEMPERVGPFDLVYSALDRLLASKDVPEAINPSH